MGLNCPSCSDICRALTCRNFGKFLTSPLMASFVFFFVGLYANSVLQMVAEHEKIDCGFGDQRCPPLPDLGHQVFPYIKFVKICDYMLYCSVASIMFRFSPLFVNYSLSLVLLRRWAFLQGLLFWMRGISVALTRQSVPQEDCVTTALGNMFIEAFYIMSGMHVTCGDIMYSGHTAGISLCVLIWTHYSKGEEWRPCCGPEPRRFITPSLDAVGDAATCSLTAVLAWVWAFTAFFFIIATHFHYSNDVFIAFIITQFVFRLYHYYIKTVLELPGWWAMFFRWFEGFDRSLLEQIRDGQHGETRRGLLNDYDEEQAKGGGGQFINASGTEAPAQAVAPLAGVPVAVFSEGPAQARNNRLQPPREEALGKQAQGAAGAAARTAVISPSGRAGGSASPVVHSGHTPVDMAYHALPEFAEHKSAQPTLVRSPQPPASAVAARVPVVVAGEISKQAAPNTPV